MKLYGRKDLDVTNLLYAEAQAILHDAKVLLNGNLRTTHGPMKIKERLFGIFGNDPSEAILVIEVGGIPVFEAKYVYTSSKYIGFPNTRYSVKNLYKLRTDTVTAYRPGVWRKKLAEAAADYASSAVKLDKSFTPIDDAALW